MSMMKAASLCLVVCAAFAPCASAQTSPTPSTSASKGFLNVNIGVQVGSDTLSTESTFDLYRETARVVGTQDVEGGPIFDFSGGYTVWRNLAIGVGFSRVSSESDVRIDATIPDPLFFDSPRSVSTTAPGANHSANMVDISLIWRMPVTEDVDVALFGGPTIFSVKQDFVSAVTVSEPGPTIDSTTLSESSKTTAGFNLGLDVSYMVTPRYGVGFLMRYTRGSVDFDEATDKVTVGGFQIGAGARFRF